MQITKYTFWIGTEAELIKLFPVMLEMKQRNIFFNIIATGQNNILKSRLLNLFSSKPNIQLLSLGPQKKSSMGLLFWFLWTFFLSLRKVSHSKKQVLFIHGDTVSTLMGALVGYLKGYQIAHVEAGLRSFNFWKPFPEEIDRVISSKFVDYHFCPTQEAIDNLKKTPGKKINTLYNTLYDSLTEFKKISEQKYPSEKPYFVFVLHRQENLFDNTFTEKIVRLVLKNALKTQCCFILHEPTKRKLEELNLLNDVLNHPNIKTYPRLPYFEFMSLLSHAEFLISDGGSNQEESFYMGLPCLTLRTETERNEGLNHNVLLERNNFSKIEKFFENYHDFKRNMVSTHTRPSSIIVDFIENETKHLVIT